MYTITHVQYTITSHNTMNMTRIWENQKRGGIANTKQVMLEILVVKHNLLTFVVAQKHSGTEPMTLHTAQHRF